VCGRFLMHPKEIVENVKLSPEFKTFHHENKDYVLSTVFQIGEGWCVGFYSKEKDLMVTFTSDPITMSKPQEVFHKDAVEPLDMGKVALDIELCDERVQILHAAKYGLHAITKKIFVLHQHHVPEYNVTLITSTFNIINIKINATTGELISDKIESAMAFKAKEE
jgi:hypothetical protein